MMWGAITLLVAATSVWAAPGGEVDVPDVFLWDGPTLVETRQIWLENKDQPLAPIPSPYVYNRTRAIVSAVKDVISKAEERMRGFAKSSLDITGKTFIPKGASKKDYVSFGRYFYLRESAPCLTVPEFMEQRERLIEAFNTTNWVATPWQRARMDIEFQKGLDLLPNTPWINCDGLTNPAFEKGGEYFASDKQQRIILLRSVYYLGLGYWFTGEERYAEKVKRYLYSFFLDPATGMNPNLLHAQGLPDEVLGRPQGIIDWSPTMVESILEPVKLLRAARSPSWTAADQAKLDAWMQQLYNWLKDAAFPKPEYDMVNNHGAWLRHMVMGMALHLGDKAFAREMAEQTKDLFIGKYVSPAGYLVFDAIRTRSSHYQAYGFLPILQNYLLEKHGLGSDGIATYTGPQKQSVKMVTDWLWPVATGQAKFPFYDIEPGALSKESVPLFWYAALATGNKIYLNNVAKVMGFSPAGFEKDPVNLVAQLPS